MIKRLAKVFMIVAAIGVLALAMPTANNARAVVYTVYDYPAAYSTYYNTAPYYPGYGPPYYRGYGPPYYPGYGPPYYPGYGPPYYSGYGPPYYPGYGPPYYHGSGPPYYGRF
jgi:hypothetical protein